MIDWPSFVIACLTVGFLAVLYAAHHAERLIREVHHWLNHEGT